MASSTKADHCSMTGQSTVSLPCPNLRSNFPLATQIQKTALPILRSSNHLSSSRFLVWEQRSVPSHPPRPPTRLAADSLSSSLPPYSASEVRSRLLLGLYQCSSREGRLEILGGSCRGHACSHVYRLLAGVGVGAISVLVPLYQSEMAPKWVRGTLVCAYQLSITLGLLAASVTNIITHKMEGTSAAYRIPLGLQLSWAVVLSTGLLILPETPRYLVKRGRTEAAGMSLSRLRRLDITHPALIDELQEIVANHEYELTLGPDTYKDIFTGSPQLGRRTLTGCGLQMLQQLTGINFIMYYSTSFFTGAGVEDPYNKSLIINIINVVSTFPGLMVIESWGRRKLLIIGAVGMAVCQLLIASFTSAAGNDLETAAQTILIVFCAIYIFFFAASWGPVVWVVTSEIYPLKIRAKAMSVSTASNWLLNFAIAYSTPFMVGDDAGAADIGPKVFFLWGTFCIVAIAFVWCMVYETSKISLEQIDEMYERVDRAWNSTRFEPSWSFQQLLDEGWSPSAQPSAQHELQQTQTQTSTSAASTASVETGSTAVGSATSTPAPATDDAKFVSQLSNVDFSY